MWKVDSGPLEAQCMLINAKPSLQPVLEVFRGQSPPCLFLPPISPPDTFVGAVVGYCGLAGNLGSPTPSLDTKPLPTVMSQGLLSHSNSISGPHHDSPCSLGATSLKTGVI